MIIPHQRSALGLHPPLKSPPTMAFWIVALAVLLITTFHVQVAQAVTYNISVNLPILTGGKRDANMALFIRANAEATLAGIDPTGQHSFNLVYYSTNGTARNATLATQAAIAEHNVVGVIGDRTSTLTIPMVLIGSKTYTWFCSGGSTSVLLSDKSLYFNFMRTIPQDSIQGEFMAGFVYAMGYRTVSVISSAEVYGASVSTTFITTAERLGITILVNQVFQTSSTNYSLPLKAIEDSGSRIIIGCILSDFSLQLLRQAKAAGLIGPNYVWVMPHAISGYSTIATQQADRELANGLLYVFPKEESLNAGYNASLQRFNQRYPGEPIPPLSFYYLDCLTTLAKGILRIAGDSGPSAVLDRSYYPDLNKYFLHPFVGVSGDVVFDDQGNRIVPFQVFNFWNGTAKAVYDVLPDLTVRQIAPIRFFSGTSSRPAEMPDRDLLYVAWLSPLGIALVVANALTLLAIVTAWAYLFANNSKPTVKPLSFPFLSIISLGCACVLMSNIASFGIPTLATCQTSLVLFSSGITMVLTSCAMKAFRIWTIFTSQVLISNKLLRTSGMMSMTAAILVVQLALLAIWGGISPQRPIRVATKAFISYSCASIDRTVNSVFVGVICVYNAVLLSSIILFSYRTRNVPSTFSESTWNFNTAQIIAVISPLVGCLALFDFGSATLVAIAAKQVVILLTTIVVFGALIGRIALVTFVVNSQTGSTTGSKVGPPANNARHLTPDPVGRHSAHSNSGPGQKGVSSAGTEVAVSKLRGVFLVS
ncbi:periplasmic binding protein-like I, partial [Catenaria anguillulae PL171]